MDDFYKHLRLHSLEATVYELAKRETVQGEFSIHAIAWSALFDFGAYYSYKQVRNALFRMRAKGLPCRHICLGSYKWIAN